MDKSLRTGVIMAGGQGTRLASVTGPLPKAMVKVRNTEMGHDETAKDTILAHQIGIMAENGITDIILVVGNKKEYIEKAFTNEAINELIPGKDITIRFFEENPDEPLGTAGAFCSKELQDMIGKEEDFLFAYADVLFDVNLKDMYKQHVEDGADVTVCISPCAEPDDRPLCMCAKGDNQITKLIPKQGKTDGPRGSLFSNTPKNGLMILNSSTFRLLEKEPTYLDMEQDILTKAIYRDDFDVRAWTTPCYIKDIGTVPRYIEGVHELSRNIPQVKNPAKHEQFCMVFKEKDLLTFDGKTFSINPDIAQAIHTLNDRGIISILCKDNPLLSSSEREDMIVDTKLIRDGNGAFFNARFENKSPESFVEILKSWNIPQQNAFCYSQQENCGVVTNLNDTQAVTYENATQAIEGSVLTAAGNADPAFLPDADLESVKQETTSVEIAEKAQELTELAIQLQNYASKSRVPLPKHEEATSEKYELTVLNTDGAGQGE